MSIAPLLGLELGPDVLLEEPEASLLLRAYPLHVDLVEAASNILAGGFHVLVGGRAAGKGLGDHSLPV
jgi:hypothetical protein